MKVNILRPESMTPEKWAVLDFLIIKYDQDSKAGFLSRAEIAKNSIVLDEGIGARAISRQAAGKIVELFLEIGLLEEQKKHDQVSDDPDYSKYKLLMKPGTISIISYLYLDNISNPRAKYYMKSKYLRAVCSHPVLSFLLISRMWKTYRKTTRDKFEKFSSNDTDGESWKPIFDLMDKMIKLQSIDDRRLDLEIKQIFGDKKLKEGLQREAIKMYSPDRLDATFDQMNTFIESMIEENIPEKQSASLTLNSRESIDFFDSIFSEGSLSRDQIVWIMSRSPSAFKNMCITGWPGLNPDKWAGPYMPFIQIRGKSVSFNKASSGLLMVIYHSMMYDLMVGSLAVSDEARERPKDEEMLKNIRSVFEKAVLAFSSEK